MESGGRGVGQGQSPLGEAVIGTGAEFQEPYIATRVGPNGISGKGEFSVICGGKGTKLIFSGTAPAKLPLDSPVRIQAEQ